MFPRLNNRKTVVTLAAGCRMFEVEAGLSTHGWLKPAILLPGRNRAQNFERGEDDITTNLWRLQNGENDHGDFERAAFDHIQRQGHEPAAITNSAPR